MSISHLTDLAGCTLALNKSVGLTSSSNRVTAWPDQSGNGNDPSIAVAPYFVSGGRVNFGFASASDSGGTTRLDLASGVPIDKQSFTAVIIGSLNGIGVVGSGGIIFGFDSPGIFVQIHGNQLEFPNLPLSAITAFPTGPCVIVLRLSASAAQFLINGQTYTATAASAGTRSGNASIGNSQSFGSGSLCPLAIDEIAFYSRAISDVETAEVVAYAQANYSGIEMAPTGRLIIDGDSIGFGFYGSGSGTGYSSINNGWASLLSLPSGVEIENIAIPAQEQQTCTANVSTRVVPLAAGVDKCAVICEGGSNDLADGRTGAQLFADQKTYGSACKAAGIKVALTTVTPRALIETERQANRALLLADFNIATAHPRIWLAGTGVTYGDALIDVGNNPTIGQSGQNTTPNYQDGLHQTGQGHVIYAADVQDVIPFLFPSAPSNTTLLSCFLGRFGMFSGILASVAVSVSLYFRPDGTSKYLRPDGTSLYQRP